MKEDTGNIAEEQESVHRLGLSRCLPMAVVHRKDLHVMQEKLEGPLALGQSSKGCKCLVTSWSK